MSKMIDLTGQRFGKLTAVRPTEERKNSQVIWECRCDCGNTIMVRGSNLTSGSTQSCGCSRSKDLTGQRFGNLTVVRTTEKRSGTNVVWECQCDCGKTAYVRGGNLLSGKSQSCGCLRKEDLTGQRFGKLTAVRPTEKRKSGCVVWECQCDCGKTVFVISNRLINGKSLSCGCGRFKDITGQRFGKLVVLRPTDERYGRNVIWECQCDCGNTARVVVGNLIRGTTKSCGCLRGRKRSQVNT